jgi:flagellar hook assembly protein FlgD
LSADKAFVCLYQKGRQAAMTMVRLLFAALALALAAPGAALAADRFVVRDEPVASGSAAVRLVAREAPLTFDLVGLHWRGTGRVWFRTWSPAGDWSVWRDGAPEAEDLPDPGSREDSSRRGWRFGSPYWTGAADGIQYRTTGRVSRLRAFFLWSDPQSRPGPMLRLPAERAPRPSIIRRSEWGADESIVRARPSYASAVRFAVVHHTAGTNSYSASESAAIVRGIERYHVLANGWNDIGYNFLVDKYGQVFEGRGGGITRNVVGAHAQGFNTGSTGVAVLGNYESGRISGAARAALVKLLAWRLDLAHVDPLSRLTWISGGNPKYPAGTSVSLRAVSGHRDTGPTSCPGSALYAQLPGIARDVATHGLPKLYDPRVTGSLGGPVRFTARLSAELPWTVTITDSEGAEVASGGGTGDVVDWTWDAAAVPYGQYRYVIAAGLDTRPAVGAVPAPPPLEVTRLHVGPRAISPDGDGVHDSAVVSYSLSTPATVELEVLNAAAKVVRSLAGGQSYRAGTPSLVWDGRNASGKLVRDGRYRVRLTAAAPGQEASKSRRVVVDRTLGDLAVGPTPFSPNGDGRLDATAVSFNLSRDAEIRVRVMDGDRAVATAHRPGALPAGSSRLSWDGRTSGGRVADGQYRILVEATTDLGTRTLSAPLTVDTRAPIVRIVSARHRKDGRTAVRLWLSEAATVKLRYGSPHRGDVRTVERQAGYTKATLPYATRVRAHAVDAAANVGPRVKARVGG